MSLRKQQGMLWVCLIITASFSSLFSCCLHPSKRNDLTNVPTRESPNKQMKSLKLFWCLKCLWVYDFGEHLGLTLRNTFAENMHTCTHTLPHGWLFQVKGSGLQASKGLACNSNHFPSHLYWLEAKSHLINMSVSGDGTCCISADQRQTVTHMQV